ncbi:MAG: ABC transporter ATP-binding protein [Leptolyngbya sp. SIOISBB]|nr:ABC transporter ATP-binding protein [Leptolyngbya sp. SIOISBB]
MSDTVIQVENLGKRYAIGHQAARGSRYVALRDIIANGVQSLGEKIRCPQKAFEQTSQEEFWALKNISFEVRQGEVIGIIGRNGAGKSTLLKLLSRITEPTTGKIRLRGRVASLLEVGTGFHPELTGRENIFLNGSILGMSKVEICRKFEEIVDFAEIERFLDTPVKRYSSGMYVRLAFAVAAHLEPEILVVDEVLAVGDAAFQKKCLGKMEDVAHTGRTILFVSHNMGAVSSLCERGIFLQSGQIFKNGVVEDVIAEYMEAQETSASTESLVNHPNRTAGVQQLLTKFSVGSKNGIVYYGKSLRLKIGYEFDSSINNPQFCIAIYTFTGIRVLTLISDYQPNNIPKLVSGCGEVTCEIPRIVLMPGNYTVNLQLWQPGQKLDEIQHVSTIRVEWLERIEGQFNWNLSLGVIYADANWCINGV